MAGEDLRNIGVAYYIDVVGNSDVSRILTGANSDVVGNSDVSGIVHKNNPGRRRAPPRQRTHVGPFEACSVLLGGLIKFTFALTDFPSK